RPPPRRAARAAPPGAGDSARSDSTRPGSTRPGTSRRARPLAPIDVAERLADAAVRELKEETGLDVEVVRIVGLYRDPHHVIAYGDGELTQEFSVRFETRVVEQDPPPTGGDDQEPVPVPNPTGPHSISAPQTGYASSTAWER
ncbi:NUDIX domain-containing protein, partial [Frankia sp. CNm7]|uniref:NUDIX hydrolase n=1 Tax=Frankia nepalensis TaxID=1836974 RepID=UPI00193251D9